MKRLSTGWWDEGAASGGIPEAGNFCHLSRLIVNWRQDTRTFRSLPAALQHAGRGTGSPPEGDQPLGQWVDEGADDSLAHALAVLGAPLTWAVSGPDDDARPVVLRVDGDVGTDETTRATLESVRKSLENIAEARPDLAVSVQLGAPRNPVSERGPLVLRNHPLCGFGGYSLPYPSELVGEQSPRNDDHLTLIYVDDGDVCTARLSDGDEPYADWKCVYNGRAYSVRLGEPIRRDRITAWWVFHPYGGFTSPGPFLREADTYGPSRPMGGQAPYRAENWWPLESGVVARGGEVPYPGNHLEGDLLMVFDAKAGDPYPDEGGFAVEWRGAYFVYRRTCVRGRRGTEYFWGADGEVYSHSQLAARHGEARAPGRSGLDLGSGALYWVFAGNFRQMWRREEGAIPVNRLPPADPPAQSEGAPIEALDSARAGLLGVLSTRSTSGSTLGGSDSPLPAGFRVLELDGPEKNLNKG